MVGRVAANVHDALARLGHIVVPPLPHGRYGSPQTWDSEASILDCRVVETKWCIQGPSQPPPKGRPNNSVKSDECVGTDGTQHQTMVQAWKQENRRITNRC
ncbi:hypothetical protein MTO96_006360 [Rhipicephalus appendiculatus]